MDRHEIELEILIHQVNMLEHVLQQDWYYDCIDKQRYDLTRSCGQNVLKALIASEENRIQFLKSYLASSFDKDKEE